MKKLLLLLSFFILSPVAFSANTHNYTCSEFGTQNGGVICTGDNTLTFDGTAGYIYDSVPIFLLSADTWYYSFSVSGISGTGIYGSINTAGVPFTDSIIDVPYETSGASDGMYFSAGELGSYFLGTITNICASDTSGGCEGTAPPAPPNTFGSSSAAALWISMSSTTQNVVNNSFNFIVLFIGTLLVFWLILSIMRAFLGSVRRM